MILIGRDIETNGVIILKIKKKMTKEGKVETDDYWYEEANNREAQQQNIVVP